MRLHPIHPMLVHLPVACWTLTPVCDELALWLGGAFFWQAGALLSAFGVAGGALAATFGALDLPRAKPHATRLALTHAALMASTLALVTASLIGRIDAGYAPHLPAPAWAILTSALALLVMLGGAWCGGEMVYGRGVGITSPPEKR